MTALYCMTARVDTLDALDSLQALKDADELKSKLLFSVVVVRKEILNKFIFHNIFQCINHFSYHKFAVKQLIKVLFINRY